MATPQPIMWKLILDRMPRGQWVEITKIYGIVRENVALEPDDFDPSASDSSNLRWRRDVRNILQYRKEIGELLWDEQDRYMLPGSNSEYEYRMALWAKLHSMGGPDNLEPQVLGDVHRGNQGIYFDKTRTGDLTPNGGGATFSVRHSGRHYPDDLSDEGVIYHYPATNRPGRDRAEVDATKMAGRMGLPVFVIIPSSLNPRLRNVKLGWIRTWDDEARIFHILFAETPQKLELDQVDEEEEFIPTVACKGTKVEVESRKGQQKFRVDVLRRYGPRCAVCDFAILEALTAAHIIDNECDGTNDPRNGLILCATHHKLFDSGLFMIDPISLAIRARRDFSLEELRIGHPNLLHLKNRPHDKALSWHCDKRKNNH